MRSIAGLLALLVLSPAAQAEVKVRTLEYRDGDAVLEGYLAWDDAKVKPGATVPGVLVVHQWLGITDHERERSRRLAELGYVAFACDIYGKGVRPADRSEAPK